MTATAILETGFKTRVLGGLRKKSIVKCSRWAESYRIMSRPFPGPWTFLHHPWLRAMHDSSAVQNIGQKGAQMGFTETMLNIVFFSIDIKGIDCLYILPAQTPDAKDFSASRFDPALENSTYLSRLFSDVRNIGHKRAGSVNLFVRGSRSRGGLKSIPVGLVVADERDEMNQANVTLALERTSGQLEKQLWAISTPRIDNEGINKDYLTSTQEHFCFRCPSCQQYTELIFPQCLVMASDKINDPLLSQSYLKCKECNVKLPHETKTIWLADGEWVPMNLGVDVRGFQIPQLYSCTVHPGEIANSYLKAQLDPADEQEFWNSKLGLPHVVKGARVTDVDIMNCTASYLQRLEESKGVITMGVDVGTHLHYILKKWDFPLERLSDDINADARPKIIKIGTVTDFEALDTIMAQYGVYSCVIDANPERRKATEFARRLLGRVKLCFYGESCNGREVTTPNAEEHTITVDRTNWLDLTLGRYKNVTISLPQDLPFEFKTHIKSLVRIYLKDKSGNSVGRYVKGNDPDHYAHADNYAEIALRFVGSMMGVRPVERKMR